MHTGECFQSVFWSTMLPDTKLVSPVVHSQRTKGLKRPSPTCREITQPRAIVLVFGPSGKDGQFTDMSEPAGRRRRLCFHLQELKYVNTRSSAAKDHPSGGSAVVKTGPENSLWEHETWAHFSGVPNRWTPLHSWILMDVLILVVGVWSLNDFLYISLNAEFCSRLLQEAMKATLYIFGS